MRFFVAFWPDARQPSAPPSGNGGEMSDYARRSTDSGVLVSQGMYAPAATEITLADGEFSVSQRNGEAFGFAYLEAPSQDEVERHVREFLEVNGGGRTVIRQLREA